jgi:hypothetical protein
MNKRLVLAGGLSLMLALMVVGLASAANNSGRSDAAKAASATAKFHELQVALDNGYEKLPAVNGPGGCADSGAADPGAGAMGVHYLKGSEVDGNLDAQKPEVLVYEPQANGASKLVALEYVVPGNLPRPSLFGQEFSLTNLAPYGNPDANVWTLHAWIWKPNPSGLLKPWNPRVTCDNA